MVDGCNMALFFMGNAGANPVFCVGLDCNRTSDHHHSLELIIQFSCLVPAKHLGLAPRSLQLFYCFLIACKNNK